MIYMTAVGRTGSQPHRSQPHATARSPAGLAPAESSWLVVSAASSMAWCAPATLLSPTQSCAFLLSKDHLTYILARLWFPFLFPFLFPWLIPISGNDRC